MNKFSIHILSRRGERNESRNTYHQKIKNNNLTYLLTFIGLLLVLSIGQTQSNVISAFLFKPSPISGFFKSSG